MVSNPPKVSFIPKSPLAQEESFLMRRRPRSITGFLAIFLFVMSIGSYAGLSFYEGTLSSEVVKTAESIASTQREFLQSPEINEAKVFRARADLARELLNQHIVISPVFSFLSSSTLGSILYDSFAFKRDKGNWALSLTGESPSYASLAYQADVLSKKNKENEFVSFSITNIALTKSGTVTFALSVEFAQNQLLYASKAASPEEGIPTREISTPTTPTVLTTPSFGTGTRPSAPTTTTPVLPNEPPVSVTATATPELATSTSIITADSGWTVSPVAPTSTTPSAAKPATAPAPVKSSFWSWFKFW
jgi:hypothetical protein